LLTPRRRTQISRQHSSASSVLQSSQLSSRLCTRRFTTQFARTQQSVLHERTTRRHARTTQRSVFQFQSAALLSQRRSKLSARRSRLKQNQKDKRKKKTQNSPRKMQNHQTIKRKTQFRSRDTFLSSCLFSFSGSFVLSPMRTLCCQFNFSLFFLFIKKTKK